MRIEANDKLFIDSSLTYNSDYNSEVKFAGNGSELLIAPGELSVPAIGNARSERLI